MLQKLMLMTLKPERLLANLMCLLFEGLPSSATVYTISWKSEREKRLVTYCFKLIRMQTCFKGTEHHKNADVRSPV